MYDDILVPTDGSEPAERAGDDAIALADRFDASIHAIHVVARDEYPERVEAEATAELTRHGEASVRAIADRAADAGVEATTAVIETAEPIHAEIGEYVTGNGIDLVVMGTHGRTGLDRLLLGSVAERTLRSVPVPVLTVHEDTEFDGEFERVLAPTDGSDTANAAADHAIEFATATGAALHVVHSVDLASVPNEYGTGSIMDALEESGRRAVDEVIERAEESGVRSVEASILTGTPARGIVDYATERDVDLIVMGTHGRSGLERYLLGSVTEKVVRLAEQPVLSISPVEDT